MKITFNNNRSPIKFEDLKAGKQYRLVDTECIEEDGRNGILFVPENFTPMHPQGLIMWIYGDKIINNIVNLNLCSQIEIYPIDLELVVNS